MNRIRKGDEVVVIAGRDKGRRGRVLRVSPADGKVLVENINIVKKTVRPNPNTGEAGGIVEQERLLDASNERAVLAAAMKELALISGQQPSVTRARKSIAGFGIRDGWPIGCRVTLRRARMYGFFERLVNIAIPRIRDFRGLSRKSFDGRGNLTIGVREQIVFPEIDYDKVDQLRGLDIAITTSTASDEEAGHLLAAMNFPFRD